MKLVQIAQDGNPAEHIDSIPDIAREVGTATAEMYRSTGFVPPWIGYLALDGDRCVGTCAFKAPPVDGCVEFAYYTFPENEGRGMATRMAQCLIELAHEASDQIRIRAQTLPEHNASTRVLEKIGFRKIGELKHPEDGEVWEWELGTTADPLSRSNAFRRECGLTLAMSRA